MEKIDYSKSTELIIPISNLPNTEVKRYFKVGMQATSLNTIDNLIKIDGEVIHRVLVDGVEIPAPGIENRYKCFSTTNDDKVNEQGQLDPEGTIGQYNFLYWNTFYKVISPQEAIISSILRNDSLGMFN